MSDDIGMEALSGTVPERSAAAVAAGCDVVLHCNGPLKERVAVAEAVGAMNAASQARALHVLETRPKARALDIPALTAELEALI